MKNVCFFLFLIVSLPASAQIIDFPDANFKNALVNTKCVDTDGDNMPDIDADSNDDGEIEVSEALKVTYLSVSNKQISSLEGIENFKNLVYLDCTINKLTTLDLQGLNYLTSLWCSANLIMTLDIGGLHSLEYLYCSNTQMTSLNVQGLNKLKYLFCTYNKLTSLNLQGLTSLTDLVCYRNKLDSINIRGLSQLVNFSCSFNNLASLDLRELVNLEDIDCTDNQIRTLNIKGLTKLKGLYCRRNLLSSLDVAGLFKLDILTCDENKLVNLYTSGSTNLATLSCGFNELKSLDLEGLTNLKALQCTYNHLISLNIKGTKVDQGIKFERNSELSYICCNDEIIDFIKELAIRNGQNCEVNSECTISSTINTTTDIHIYPNPVKDILYLDTDEKWTKVELFDIAGRIMRAMTSDVTSIDVSSLAMGTYIIRLRNGNKVGRVKFVKL